MRSLRERRRAAAVAGLSAAHEYRLRLTQWRAVSQRVAFTVTVTVVVFAVVIALAVSGVAAAIPAGVLAGTAVVALWAATRRPAVAATITTVLLWIFTAIFLGQPISRDLSPVDPDYGTTVLVLGLIGCVAGIMAHRAPLGKPWVTTLQCLIGFYFATLAALLSYHGRALPLGLAGMAVVLARRYGMLTAVSDIWHESLDTVRRWIGRPPDEIERFREGADVERRTAVLLDRWRRQYPKDVHVLHDLSLARMPSLGNVDHLVVSARGVTLLDSVRWSGQVSVDDLGQAAAGSVVSHHGTAQDAVAATAARAAAVADTLGMPVSAVLVVYGAEVPSRRLLLGAAGSEVAVVVPSSLTAELGAGPDDTLTGRQAKRLARRARRWLPTASARQDSADLRARPPGVPVGPAVPVGTAGPGPAVTSGPSGSTVLLSTDVDAGARTFRKVLPGSRVVLTGDEGAYIDMRAVSGIVAGGPDSGLEPVVHVCAEHEWYAALREERQPRTKAWPASRVRAE